ELDVVESVEEFRAKFERCVLLESGSLGDREIPIVDAGTSQEIARHVSEGKQWNAGLEEVIHARVLVGTGSANEVSGIEPEISGFRPVTGSVAVSLEILLRISGMMCEWDRTDDVGAIQEVILLTGI